MDFDSQTRSGGTLGGCLVGNPVLLLCFQVLYAVADMFFILFFPKYVIQILQLLKTMFFYVLLYRNLEFENLYLKCTKTF